MEKNKLKIIFLDRNTVGPFELKEIFSKKVFLKEKDPLERA